MKGILIRIKDGHKLDGAGEFLGKDAEGTPHTFWKSMGHMEVPLELAIALEREKPQRYEIVDRNMADKLLGNNNLAQLSKPQEKKPKPVEKKPIEETVKEPEVSKEFEIEPEDDEEPNFDELQGISKKFFKGMTKDEINDWAAKRDYDVNPSKDNKGPMINSLIKQIEERTGIKVE